MSFNINTGRSGVLGRMTSQNTASVSNINSSRNSGNSLGKNGAAHSGTDVRALKRMLSDSSNRQSGQDKNIYSDSSNNNIVTQSQTYAESLRAARAKSKKTSLQLKKLRYNFKSISTQLLRSKTSTSARQVASKARREVIRLKRQRQNGEYDEEELQSAITHAQAMERVAKKKVRHLLEEEMVKAKDGGPCAGELEEDEELEDKLEDEVAGEVSSQLAAQDGVLSDEASKALQEQMQIYREMARAEQEEILASMDDMMSEMMDEMSESMEELLEDSGLEDLAWDMMGGAVGTDMDPADYEMMKIKHRSKELQDIAKADAEYLKAVFDRMERAKDAAIRGVVNTGGSAGVTFASGGVGVGQPAGGDSVRAALAQVMGGAPSAEASAGVTVVGGGIDISL